MPLVLDSSTAPLVVCSSAPSPFTATPFSPNSSDVLESPICPLCSTEIKLVRTFEIGRESSPVTLNDAAGERPREGGEVDPSFCSNFARKEAKPEFPADMTRTSSTVSKCDARRRDCRIALGVRHV